ncbi:MAG: competence/damage-inducible protein A [Spirulina sp. SIO3F2]|nr:competence/damage-inducible protein A [Spirulina sp. SIO3F2]
MSAEIICVGTELLLGEILNGNARFLAAELARLGIPHYFQTVVGDNESRIHQVLELAVSRSQILLFTGGLGPTPDDLTTAAIASYFNTDLVERPEVIQDITTKFAQRQRQMTDNNRKQALLPMGAEILPNITGTAPGMIWSPQSPLQILTFPGVPSEMHQMWQDTAVPFLRAQGWGESIIYSQVLRFWGIGESTLANKVDRFFDLQNPTVAPYASGGEVRLRLSARAKSEADALAMINPVAEQIKAIAGEDCFGQDEDTLAAVVGQLLHEREQTVAVAESCTGGGLGAMFTEIPGSSSYFRGGVIAYANEVKAAVLNVMPETLNQFGAVSEPTAKQMALGVQQALQTDWGISITGIAGPEGGTPTKPVGLVYVGIAGPDQSVAVFEYQFGGRDRATIRHRSACHALDRLRRRLLH